jgi:hypothetical protein
MIYIDPETNKYTTDDPGAATRPEAVVSDPSTDNSSSRLVASLGAAAVLIGIAYLRYRHRSTA